jgi:REP element-mobilizing transposase RayT
MQSQGQHRRKPLRLENFDYRHQGYYFVTICTFGRRPILASIKGGSTFLTEIGNIAHRELLRTAELRPYIELLSEEFVIMPNHVHAIIRILLASEDVRSLGTIVGQFKAATTKWANRIDQTPERRIWQRNYYEHVIRNNEDLERIQEYIHNNPLKWELDSLYIAQ